MKENSETPTNFVELRVESDDLDKNKAKTGKMQSLREKNKPEWEKNNPKKLRKIRSKGKNLLDLNNQDLNFSKNEEKVNPRSPKNKFSDAPARSAETPKKKVGKLEWILRKTIKFFSP